MKPKDLTLQLRGDLYYTNEIRSRPVICSTIVKLDFPELPPRLILRLTKHKPRRNPHWAQLKYDSEEDVLRAVSYAPHFAPYFSIRTFVPAYSHLIELVQSNPSLPFFSIILPPSTH